MFFLDHIWMIPLLPAIGAASMFFFGRKLSKSAVNGICVGLVVLAFVWACLAVWQYTGYSAAHPGSRSRRFSLPGWAPAATPLATPPALARPRSTPTPASCSILSLG